MTIGRLDVASLKRNFRHPKIRPVQESAFAFIAKHGGGLLELWTGAGKTDIGMTFLKAFAKQGKGPLFYICPTKAVVEQIGSMYANDPDVAIAEGRNAHRCLYIKDEPSYNADEIPCVSMFRDNCAHFVDQQTGKTAEEGATPCPYYQQKFEAKQAKIVVCTVSFFIFAQLFSREFESPAGLVIDEVHRLSSIFRRTISFEISDYHLGQAIELLHVIGAEKEAGELEKFLKAMIRIVRKKPANELLDDNEIQSLMAELVPLDARELRAKIGKALKEKRIDPKAQMTALKQLEVVARDMKRYIRALEYSLPGEERKALNYTYAFYKKELGERERVQYKLVVKAYSVEPLIRCMLVPHTLAYSATIGDPKILKFETGIDLPFFKLPSDFPVGNVRVFMPTNTPNLAHKKRRKGEPTRVLRNVAKACKGFAHVGLRSLVVVISEKERAKFLALSEEEGVRTLSYGNGVHPKDAALEFKREKKASDVLVGTVANYGEGVDLPKQLAPVIFFLRPSYPPPKDPQTVFELRRFRESDCWRLWNWRVMIEALQVRGRNIRSDRDLGVTFFISQQFRRFVFGSLPEWLQKAYRHDRTFDECVEETKELLAK